MLVRSLFALATLLLAAPALAGDGFVPIPADQTGGHKTGLEIRIAGYDGSVNGQFSVDVRNPQKQSVEFAARGLYFVPNGNPDTAPQRLGAVGPFRVKTSKGWEQREKMTIAAGATERLQLDVYCIDSHRGSPSSSTGFHVGKDRIPKTITDDIYRDATKASEKSGGLADPRAKSDVQSQVWKNRDKKWVELDGEGKQEVGKKK
jgi:hypothetical protein